MWRSDFQYYAAFESPDGDHIGDVHLDIDWIPALRWAEFEQDLVSAVMPEYRCGRPVIEPVWSPHANPPYIEGVSICRNTDAAQTTGFPLAYFSSAVVEASSELVTSGALVAGQGLDYKVFALADAECSDQKSARIDIVAVDAAPAIDSSELAPLMAQAGAHAENVTAPGSVSTVPVATVMPIFIPQQVFDEATELAAGAGDIETGGILVGKLCRDIDGTLFSRVTAQIPAEHTTATRQSLRFTPETWAKVDAAVKLRGLAEIQLGFWHSHPFFCVKCSPQQRALCPFSAPAFSAADRDLHREVFQKSWSIALLLSFLGDERPSYDLFGWNHGQIEALKYFALPQSSGNSGESR